MRRVVGPVAVLRDGAGRLRYLYAGTVLPDGLNEDDVARLTRKGLVAEVEDPAPADPEDGADDSNDDESDGEAEAPARPKRTASREAWAEYRAAQGHDVDGLDRQALIDLGD